jgi:hypothetical protein
MTRPVTSQRFRQRKLNTRTPLQVLREDQLDHVDPEQPNTPKVETGVEKHEEHVSEIPIIIFAIIFSLFDTLLMSGKIFSVHLAFPTAGIAASRSDLRLPEVPSRLLFPVRGPAKSAKHQFALLCSRKVFLI